jgi:hypothetical protein
VYWFFWAKKSHSYGGPVDNWVYPVLVVAIVIIDGTYRALPEIRLGLIVGFGKQPRADVVAADSV